MEITAVEGLPEVRPGDDLAALLAEQCDLSSANVVCVASTVVSKAEGRTADLADYEAGERARSIAARISDIADEEKDPRFAQAVVEASEELVIEVPLMLAVLPFGHVTVNAGIDRSNVPDADLLLLPEDPSASARRIREGLADHVESSESSRESSTATAASAASTATMSSTATAATPDGGEGETGTDEDDLDAPAVIVTDTSGRPFRKGQRGVVVGWDGIPAARDWRGEHDRDGRELSATVQAVVDELAAASNLVTGEGAGGTPAAVISGFDFGDHAGSDDLFRDREGDLIRDALEGWSYVRD